MTDFQIDQGDTAPLLTVDLAYNNGTPAQLAAATVVMVIKAPGATIPYLTKTMGIVGDGTTGKVSYQFTSADTLIPGDYLVQFTVTFAGGVIQTFPTVGYKTLRINPSLAGVYTPQPDGYTVADLLRDARQHLDSGLTGMLNKLNADLAVGTETLTLKYPASGVRQGTRISIGLEDCYVWDLPNTGSTSVVVQRGFADTPALPHPAGELVRVSPRWSDAEILRAANTELASLPGKGLFRVSTADYIADPILLGYPAPSDMISADVLDLSWLQKSATEYRPQIDDYRVELGVPIAEFPTGNALFISRRPLAGQPFRLTYKANFGALQTPTDQVSGVSGLPVSALDLLPLGAALRLMAGRAIRRTEFTTQGDNRRPEEVRPNDVLAAPNALRQIYQARLQDEISQLNEQYAVKLRRRSLMR